MIGLHRVRWCRMTNTKPCYGSLSAYVPKSSTVAAGMDKYIYPDELYEMELTHLFIHATDTLFCHILPLTVLIYCIVIVVSTEALSPLKKPQWRYHNVTWYHNNFMCAWIMHYLRVHICICGWEYNQQWLDNIVCMYGPYIDITNLPHRG